MRGKYHRRVIRHLIQLGDKDSPHISKAVDHRPVMHNFMPHIDRGAEFLQRNLDDLNRAIDTGTKAAWCGQMQKFTLFCHASVLA